MPDGVGEGGDENENNPEAHAEVGNVLVAKESENESESGKFTHAGGDAANFHFEAADENGHAHNHKGPEEKKFAAGAGVEDVAGIKEFKWIEIHGISGYGFAEYVS